MTFCTADNVTPLPDLAKLAGTAIGGARVRVVGAGDAVLAAVGSETESLTVFARLAIATLGEGCSSGSGTPCSFGAIDATT